MCGSSFLAGLLQPFDTTHIQTPSIVITKKRSQSSSSKQQNQAMDSDLGIPPACRALQNDSDYQQRPTLCVSTLSRRPKKSLLLRFPLLCLLPTLAFALPSSQVSMTYEKELRNFAKLVASSSGLVRNEHQQRRRRRQQILSAESSLTQSPHYIHPASRVSRGFTSMGIYRKEQQQQRQNILQRKALLLLFSRITLSPLRPSTIQYVWLVLTSSIIFHLRPPSPHSNETKLNPLTGGAAVDCV